MNRSIVWSLTALAGKSGAGVRVAVIDTGIHAGHPHVGGISGGVGIDQDGRTHDDLQDRLGHGTAVAAAIREKAPAVELVAVKVFDRRLVTTGAALVAGIRWAIAQDVHLINLSLGTTNEAHRDALVAAVAEAEAAGALVVAAAPQPDANWLPGALPGVVAVDVDWMCPRDECHATIDDDGRVKVRASGYPRPIPGVPVDQNVSGLSFAVANASGFVALMLESRGVSPRITRSGHVKEPAAWYE
jgi:subtilisin family serine protease